MINPVNTFRIKRCSEFARPDCGHEGTDLVGILDSLARLDTRRDINRLGAKAAHRLADIIRIQPTGENQGLPSEGGTSDQSNILPPPPYPSTKASRRIACADGKAAAYCTKSIPGLTRAALM
jgi:hypothetical protein